MADETTPVTPETTETPEKPEPLSPAQQELVNKQIQARLKRQESQLASQFNTTLEEKMNALRAELAPATPATPAAEDGDGKISEKEQEFRKQQRALIEAEQNKARALELQKKQVETQLQQLQEQVRSMQKGNAIREAMSGISWLKAGDVERLTSDMVEYDDALKSYVVKENGVIKETAALEPMTLSEFYSDFAQKNSWYVKSDALSGTGALPGGNPTQGSIRKKSDFKGDLKKMSDWIEKNGFEAYENLPA